MEDPINRMVTQRKRGRPSLAEKPVDAMPVVVTAPNLPPMLGVRCPSCGRGIVPRITHTAGMERYCNCPLCGKRMRVSYSNDLKARIIQPM